jgi:hypothetical protein
MDGVDRRGNRHISITVDMGFSTSSTPYPSVASSTMESTRAGGTADNHAADLASTICSIYAQQDVHSIRHGLFGEILEAYVAVFAFWKLSASFSWIPSITPATAPAGRGRIVFSLQRKRPSPIT